MSEDNNTIGPSDREFLDRVKSVVVSDELLGKLRLYFECLGFLKKLADREAITDSTKFQQLMDFIDDYLQLLLQQAKAENTTLGMLIFEGFTNPRSVAFHDAFRLRKEQKKAATERRIFEEFCRAAGLQLEAGSLKSERPPKPDLSCTIKGREFLAELIEITDERVARRRAKSLRSHRVTGGSYSQLEPLVTAFESKAANVYQTDGAPLLVLAYYDRQTPPVDVEPELIERAAGGIAAGARLEGMWEAAFVYDSCTKTILWKFPKTWPFTL